MEKNKERKRRGKMCLFDYVTNKSVKQENSGDETENVNWLEEIFFAVNASGPGETFIRQRGLTVGALEALGVPVSVQHLQDELVQDVLTAAGTLGDLCGDEQKEALSHTQVNENVYYTRCLQKNRPRQRLFDGNDGIITFLRIPARNKPHFAQSKKLLSSVPLSSA